MGTLLRYKYTDRSLKRFLLTITLNPLISLVDLFLYCTKELASAAAATPLQKEPKKVSVISARAKSTALFFLLLWSSIIKLSHEIHNSHF